MDEKNNLISFDGDFNMDVFTVPEMTEEESKIDDELSQKQIEEVQNIDDESSEEIEEIKESGDLDKSDEDEQEEKVAADKSDEGEGSSSNIYTSFANVLVEKGILSSPESDKIKSVDDLVSIINSEVSNREFADLNDQQKTYLQALRNGVPDLETREHLSIMNELTSIDDVMLSDNQELRKELIKQDFIEQGMAIERAEKLTKRSIELGEDLEDAKDALTSLKTIKEKTYKEKLKQSEQAKIKQQEDETAQMTKLKESVTSTEEIVPGMKISEAQKTKLFSQMTKPVGKVGNQLVNEVQKARIENPIDFEIKLNYIFQITNGFKDFSKLVKQSKTKAIKELDKQLKGDFTNNGLGTSGKVNNKIKSDQPNSFQNLGDII